MMKTDIIFSIKLNSCEHSLGGYNVMGSIRYQKHPVEGTRIRDDAFYKLEVILNAAVLAGDITVSRKEKLMKRYNFAYLEYDVTTDQGLHSNGSLLAHSQVSTRHEPSDILINYDLIPLKPNQYDRHFFHLQVGPDRNIDTEPSHPRQGDAEAKLLEEFACMFDDKTVGTVLLYTRLEPCLSCDYEIIQFVELFDKIELVIYYDEEYNSTKG
jgi:hypothetical protein